jgi:hypothetical protein
MWFSNYFKFLKTWLRFSVNQSKFFNQKDIKKILLCYLTFDDEKIIELLCKKTNYKYYLKINECVDVDDAKLFGIHSRNKIYFLLITSFDWIGIYTLTFTFLFKINVGRCSHCLFHIKTSRIIIVFITTYTSSRVDILNWIFIFQIQFLVIENDKI